MDISCAEMRRGCSQVQRSSVSQVRVPSAPTSASKVLAEESASCTISNVAMQSCRDALPVDHHRRHWQAYAGSSEPRHSSEAPPAGCLPILGYANLLHHSHLQDGNAAAACLAQVLHARLWPQFHRVSSSCQLRCTLHEQFQLA